MRQSLSKDTLEYQMTVNAGAFRILLMNGFAVKAEIVKWAENISTVHAEVPLSLSELKYATTLPVNETIFRLNSLSKGETPALVFRLVAGKIVRYLRSNETSRDKAIKTLEWMSRSSNLSAEEKIMMSDLHPVSNESLQLQVTDRMLQEKQLQRVLELYEPFDLWKPDEWDRAEEKIGAETTRVIQLMREEQFAYIREHSKARLKWWKRWM